MADDALVVAQKAWDAWVAGDLDAFLALWHENGVWTNAGRSAITRERHGVSEIGELARAVGEYSGGTLKATPLELAQSGPNTVLGYFRVEAQRPEASIDQVGLQRLVITDGKIESLHNMYADVYEQDEFYKNYTE